MSTTAALPLPPPSDSPPVATIDANTDAADVAILDFRTSQADGTHPFVHRLNLDRPIEADEVLPDNATVERRITTLQQVLTLARSRHWRILVMTFSASTTIEVAAEAEPVAAQIAAQIRQRVRVDPPADTIPLRVWKHGGFGPKATDQALSAAGWSDISANYPTATRTGLAELVELERPTGRDKVIIWHGPPGTGKTTAMKSLLRSWESWCRGQYVADAEHLFERPSYLSDLLDHRFVSELSPLPRWDDNGDEMWKLIIAEDSDAHLLGAMGATVSPGLGRLLNLADGVTGEGQPVLVLLTTNTPPSRLHPALTRPGRCLAQIEFGPFPLAEARTWLGSAAHGLTGPPTLAEMFERRGDLTRIGEPPTDEPSRGQYL
ncbi:MAG: DUF5925 domain-containing protein [Acidimicrobiales bacterium]